MDAVDEVKSRLSIEDVIGEYLELKRSGRNFKALSPFSNEKTPSFMVSPEKQIWHDFSSARGGNMFSFVMEVEGLDFKGALELLARKAGVDLAQYRSSYSSDTSKLKARASEALELAAHFYQKQLTVNETALRYLLKQRQFTRETVLRWQLGFAPSSGRVLAEFLTKRGFSADEMKRAGLVTERARGLGDMFRGRIMIPLCDGQGNVVGFTARILADEPNAPKYINTPQTMLYDKSRQVFGLHLAKEAIRKSGYTVIVEGNLDVISSHQAGFSQVIATAGTAMTEYHIKAISRFNDDVRLCFDTDQAGIAAAERAIPIAQKVGVNLSIISLKGAKDPDELIHKDVHEWEKALDSGQYALDWLMDKYAAQLDLKSALGKRQFTDALLVTVRRLKDVVEQEHYIKKIAERTDTSTEAIASKLSLQPKTETVRRKQLKNAVEPVLDAEGRKIQNHFLAIMLAHPKLRTLMQTCKSDFFSKGSARELFRYLRANPQFKGTKKELKELKELADYVKILSLHFEEIYQSFDVEQLQVQAATLRTRLIDIYVKTQKQLLAARMRDSTNSDDLRQLMEQANKLNQLIT